MTVMILGVCALVSLIVGLIIEGWPKETHDGLGIVAIQEFGQREKENHHSSNKKCIRQKMSIYDLLPGDIVHLNIGDQVPVDGLFVSGFSVLIDESSLTGKSEPIMVNADNPFMLSGTKFQNGSSKMMVTSVGMRK
ncbi:hypothetical protein GOBAR_AA29561 [Gossypium barbadense]|uniref:P-type ATPase A domain-containing protein n=1 Tax=Gossypium barbadense TaxID=3634 RepID=A0A2P5WJ55_GOSBA|nr:hypothetical protein GOBAR_AA29561 [Gossypium barbadense]